MADEAPSQFIGIDPSSLCSLLPTRLIITGVLRDILVRHFGNKDYIEEPDLKKLVWGEDIASTGILIETVHRWRPEATEFKPAILIHANTLARMPRGVGDRRQGNDIYGDDHYVTFYVGSHTLFCIGRSPAQVELLSEEVEAELTQFAPVIRDYFSDIKRFGVTQIGSVDEVDMSQENFMVPITVGYAFEKRWKVRMQAPRLHISMSLLTSC